MTPEMIQNIMVGLTICIGGMIPALAIGMIGKAGLEAMGRNPEVSGSVQSGMILAIAFAEAIAIYSLVVALVLKFV